MTGLPVAYVSADQKHDVLERVRKGVYKLVYFIPLKCCC